jgi:hypothetical protein
MLFLFSAACLLLFVLCLLSSHFPDIIVHDPPIMIVIADGDIGQKSEDKELDADHAAEDPDQGPDARGDRLAKDHFFDKHPGENAYPDQAEKNAASAEKMDWPMRILAPKPDGEHVNETLDAPLPVIFGPAMETRVVMHLDFTHPEALQLKDGRDKTVHFSEEINVNKTFPPVGFQTAAGIMDAVMNKNGTEEVGATGEKTLHERIATVKAPTGYHVIALVHFGKKERNIGRIILKIAVHSNDNLSRRRFDAGIKAGGLAEILPEMDGYQRRKGIHFDRRLVSRSVIYEDNFKGPSDLLNSLVNFLMQFLNVSLFVIKRDHYGKIRSFLHSERVSEKRPFDKLALKRDSFLFPFAKLE